MNIASRATIRLLLLPCLLLLAACGRETKIYEDPASETTSQQNPPAIVIEPRSLPEGFFDQSVNGALADLALDGDSDSSLAIRLKTSVDTNAPGSFNGAGEGNRALLGLSQYSGKKLKDVSSLGFDFKAIAGTEPLTVLLVVDLACDGTNQRVLLADTAALAATGAAQASGYTRLTAKFDSSLWKVSGPAIHHPSQPATVLVPSDSGSSTSTLDDLLSSYPNACLKNGKTSAEGLPKNLPTAAVLISLGTPDTKTQSSVFLNRIVVGSEIHAATDWVTP